MVPASSADLSWSDARLRQITAAARSVSSALEDPASSLDDDRNNESFCRNVRELHQWLTDCEKLPLRKKGPNAQGADPAILNAFSELQAALANLHLIEQIRQPSFSHLGLSLQVTCSKSMRVQFKEAAIHLQQLVRERAAGLRDSLHAAAPSRPEPDSQFLDLNEAEAIILEALVDGPLKGEDLAEKAGYPFNSNFRKTLSSLKKRGILGNNGRGYFRTA